MDYHLSFLSYVGMVTTNLTCFILFYCCCKRCLKLCPNFSRWWKDNNPCTTIVFKPKIVNSIHSSRESLKHHNTRASEKSKNSQDEPVEATELVSLNPTNNRCCRPANDNSFKKKGIAQVRAILLKSIYM